MERNIGIKQTPHVFFRSLPRAKLSTLRVGSTTVNKACRLQVGPLAGNTNGQASLPETIFVSFEISHLDNEISHLDNDNAARWIQENLSDVRGEGFVTTQGEWQHRFKLDGDGVIGCYRLNGSMAQGNGL